MNSLNTKNAREDWEKEFNVLYIQPVLADLDNKVNEAMDLIAKDDKQGEHPSKCSYSETSDRNILSNKLMIRAYFSTRDCLPIVVNRDFLVYNYVNDIRISRVPFFLYTRTQLRKSIVYSRYNVCDSLQCLYAHVHNKLKIKFFLDTQGL